jgi:hypothetical protein
VERIERERENLAQYNVEAEKEVRNINTGFEENKQEVVTSLLKKVMDVELVVPQVVIADFEALLKKANM